MSEPIKIIVNESPVQAKIQTTQVIVSRQVQGTPGRDGADGLKLVNAETVYEFPTIGDAETLYCCTGENAVYRWVPAVGHYVCVGRDYREIETINGGVIE